MVGAARLLLTIYLLASLWQCIVAARTVGRLKHLNLRRGEGVDGNTVTVDRHHLVLTVEEASLQVSVACLAC